MPRGNRTHTVSFRLTEGQLQRLAERAQDAGETPADWCRNLVIAALEKDPALTRGERFIYEELARVRFLVGHGFRLLMEDDEGTARAWQEAREMANQKAAEIADNLIARHRKG